MQDKFEFAKEGWWRDLDLILAKAKEHDMKLWILDDSHFPTGYANGKVKECFPQYLKWYLDMRRYDVQGPFMQARIDFKLLKGRPWDKPDDSAKILGVYMAKRPTLETVPGDPVDADTIVDITAQMRMEDQLLTLDVPAGAYSIFVVFLTRKGAEDATKDYLNPLVKEATQILIDEVYETHYAHCGSEFGSTIQGFFSDEPRFGNYKGTEAWIGREDMDVAGIDVIGGQIVPGMNYHHDAYNTGGSNGEFYHYALAKLGTSAAHLDPKKGGRTMCEAFGAYGWNEGLKTMKWIADHLMVRGVNYIVPHAFDPKEFPDWDCPPHFYAHGHNPQFRYFPTFRNYVNRIMTIFRDGAHPAKVGLFYPAELEWAGACMPVEKPARELTTHQISFDIVSRDYLKTAKIEDGVYVINGERLEVLVMPYGECIPADLLPFLGEMTDAGVKVIFLDDAPKRIAGSMRVSEKVLVEEKIFTAEKMLADIVAGSSIVTLKALGKELGAYRSVVLDGEEPDLAVGEYERGGKRYYMFFNENIGTAIHTKAALPADGYVYRYDAWDDTLYTVCQEEGRIKLKLEPYESAVFVVGGKWDEEL